MMAFDKEAILAAVALPRGRSELAGHSIAIRGISVAEEVEFLAESIANPDAIAPICAACMLDDNGAPAFTIDEVRAMKAGLLKPVYFDILALSFPKGAAEETEKN